ncbi:lipid IV(A) 3-deoxy-D-manno-octulosonic acid transferase [Methylomonas sp. AM2-LC]|uniref:lipid IV(A) 3-deoxy-D-manno-octulosonic acid transferase n=1 Tax=Methylomonas sp. AM2-LC TaxID=3153301 RepID=UPI003267AA6A
MRTFYTLLFYLLLPAILCRLYWRGFKAPQYRQRWQERLGFYQRPLSSHVVWIHAVSVGETEAAFPLIKQLQLRYPQQRILLTTTTPTGSARVQALFAESVEHVYLPYDLPDVIGRFMANFQPKLAVMMEKEIWPNLFAACAARQIPIFILNARLSANSARSYLKIPRLVKPALSNIQLIAAQTVDDQSRFIEIGAKPEQVEVQGNIKFDVLIDQQILEAGQTIRKKLFVGRYVWIVASTHQGEEELILSLFSILKAHIPSLLLLIVPRHPERFQVVKKLCEEQGLTVVMRSDQTETVLAENIDIYIADSMGELKMLYAAADVAFVAGSLVAVGGHNVLEPAAIGVPVLFGAYMFNFQDIAQGMLDAGAARQCHNLDELRDAMLALYEDVEFRHALIVNAKAFVEQNQGAVDRMVRLLAERF